MNPLNRGFDAAGDAGSNSGEQRHGQFGAGTDVYVLNPDNSYTTVNLSGRTEMGVVVTADGDAYQFTTSGLHLIEIASLPAD